MSSNTYDTALPLDLATNTIVVKTDDDGCTDISTITLKTTDSEGDHDVSAKDIGTDCLQTFEV